MKKGRSKIRVENLKEISALIEDRVFWEKRFYRALWVLYNRTSMKDVIRVIESDPLASRAVLSKWHIERNLNTYKRLLKFYTEEEIATHRLRSWKAVYSAVTEENKYECLNDLYFMSREELNEKYKDKRYLL